VIYLPPIHPIGTSFRKGRNNALVAGPGDPGSPWAIGSPAGGHTAIDPALGTFDDFNAFNREAGRLGLEIALDLAWQCSPDHPWVREHPEWFRHRPDGTIKYAENPPKKYQDIYPFDFDARTGRRCGGRSPTSPCSGSTTGSASSASTTRTPRRSASGNVADRSRARAASRRAVFSEAFTRPPVMRYLRKPGSRSRTYFTWRNKRS
jgi:starch synthase (maltosyl-transferring)